MRVSGSIIIAEVVIVFTSKWIQLYRDLNNGEVTEVVAILKQKIKLGSKSSSGISGEIGSSNTSQSKSNTTFIFQISGNRYHVKAKHYSKVNKGDKVQLNYSKNLL